MVKPSSVAINFSRPRLLLVLVAALLLVWFIIRNAGLELLGQTVPDIAERLWPTSPTALINQAVLKGLSATTPVSPEVAKRLAAAIRNAPLAYEPFFVAAVQNRSMGRRAVATRQMEEASRRNPRLVPAYLFLAEQYLRDDRPADALAKIAVALRLPVSAEENDRLMRALYLLAGNVKGRIALSRALAANPPWRVSFVQYVATRGSDRGALFDVVRTSSANEDERKSFLVGLVAAEDFERAYLAWVNFLPPSAIDHVAPIYDGTFRKLPGPAPFNWELFTGDSATAEMIDDARVPPGTALSVNFFGSDRTMIATQTMLVPPGTYAMSIAAAGNSESVLGGSFSWELACLPGGSVLGRMSFGGLRANPTAHRMAVAIPANCRAETLTLFGIPGETNAQVNAEFSAISLMPQ